MERRDKLFYTTVTIVVIVVIILTFILTSSKLIFAFVPDDVLKNGWRENPFERFSEDRLLGLEKQVSLTYHNESYRAFLSVTTIKMLFMINENDLLIKTDETINERVKELNISLDPDSRITGNRIIGNMHKTSYVIYNGTDHSKIPNEKIKIIGEAWNCGPSGTSIVCIGFSQVTDNANNKSYENLENWAKIIRDIDGTFVSLYNSEIFQGEDGLIFNVKCH